MGRHGYPTEFRRKVLDVVEAVRSVANVARDLDISTETVYAWRRQDRIDRGLAHGLASTEKTALAAANKRITALANLAALSFGELVSAVRGGLRRIQRRSDLVAAFLAHTGLQFRTQ